MRIYINIETRNEKATKNSNEKFFLTIDSIEDLKKAVIDYAIRKYTWKKVLSFNVVSGLNGACNAIEKNFYQKQPLNIEARKEIYHFSKGCPKGILIWSQDAIINEA
jgi:hypothetical protein